MKIFSEKNILLKKISSLDSISPLEVDLMEILKKGNIILQEKLFFRLKPKKLEALWKI